MPWVPGIAGASNSPSNNVGIEKPDQQVCVDEQPDSSAVPQVVTSCVTNKTPASVAILRESAAGQSITAVGAEHSSQFQDSSESREHKVDVVCPAESTAETKTG